MAVFRNTVRINDELKVTKSSLVFGALNVLRVKTLPPDTFGRNGDLVIVDDTTESVEELANKRVPASVRLCQKIATPVSGGTFTIDDGTTVFTITISNIDDVVEQVNRANIPSFRASIKDRGLILFAGIPVTFADGTSDFPSAVGIAGAFGGGELEVPTGSWESFVTSAAGGLSYGAISGGDGGTAFAIVSSDSITYDGSGINIVATNAGLGLDTVDFDLDIADLTAGVGPLILSDEIAVNDGGTTLRFTFTDVVEDLDIPNAITTNGIIVRTAANTYTSRSIIESTTAGLEGGDVVNGDGVAGNPEIGVDIDNLTSSAVDLAATDELIVFDGTNNLSYTGQQIADGVETILGSIGNAYAFIAGGDGGVTAAAISSDTITFNGEGINITTANAGAGADTVDFDLDISDLTAGVGPLVGGDEIAVNDGGTTLRFTITDLLEDLDIPNSITTNGFVVRTAADTYASRTITASTDEDELGIVVTDGDGVAGDPTIGLDIDGTTSSPSDLAATDEFLVHDKSEGVGGANRSMTGQQLSDGANTLAGPDLWETISSDAGSTTANTRTDTLTIAGGTGISTAIAGDTLTITASGGSQNLFETVTGDTGSAVADTTTDTIALIGATSGGITTIGSSTPDQVTFSVTPIDLTTGAATLTTSDFIIVSDSLDTATTVALKYTFGDMITDLGLSAGISDAYLSITGGDGGTATAIGSDTITFNGEGINITATNAGAGLDTVEFDLDISDLGAGTTVALSDEIAVDQAADPNVRFSFTDVVEDLDIPNAITVNGFVVRTAADTYTSRSIAIEGAGDGDGLIIVDGDGVAGNPTLGLDIEGLPARSDIVDGDDRVAVWNSTVDANEYYLVSEIAGALASVDSFNTWARSGNGSGASVVADSATDTVTLDGGIGIFLTFTPASDTISFAFSRSGMADTAVVGADTIPFFDSGNSNEPEFRSFTDVVGDLDIPNAITVNGFVVRTAEDTYASRTIDASTDEDELGIIVTDGDGVSGDPQIGLDIDGTTSSPAEMASTDEFLVHDKSEGTAGANRSMTGTQVADGVSTILGLDALTLSTIGGQPVFTFSDTTRGPKTLSIETVTFTYAENVVSNDDWIRIGNASNAAVGHVIPHPATIIKVTAMTEDNNGNSKDIDLYIDDVLSTTGIVSFTGGAGEDEFTDLTLNIDIAAGEKIQLRGDTAGGTIEDTTITLFVKWRV